MKRPSPLPRAFSLYGTQHLPPIDNQGGIGSCASQAANHIQFTNAYSRFMHKTGIEPTRAPKDDPSACFTPRFTYNFSGPGTAWVYETIRDHGSLTVDEWVFDKDEKGGSRRVLDGKVIAATAAWPIEPGQMKKALRNRITNFEQIWMSNDRYQEKLTTSLEGQELLHKIKAAIVAGNAVVTGGYPGRWIYAPIKNTGTYGKVGDNACIAAAGNGGGGHQVTIIGYDDDITAEFAGVTLRGAFHIANSYGTGWQNGGYVWMFYDTVNTVSEHEALNNPDLYSGPMYLTAGMENKMFSKYMAQGKSQDYRIEACGEVTVGSESFPTFRLFHKEENGYLGYYAEPSNRTITTYPQANEFTLWAFIPYEKLNLFKGYSAEHFDEKYQGSYWVWACNRNDEPEEGYRFLDAGVGYASLGRSVNLATLNSGKYPVAKSWTLDQAITDHFTSKLGIAAGKDEKSNRVWTLDQFCFTDWEKDIVRGLPALYFDMELSVADRNSFRITLTRTDKAGNTEKYMPAMFRYAQSHPRYEEKGHYITFRGKIDGKPEKGFFTLSFAELLKLSEGTSFEDYKWGFEITAGKDQPVNFSFAKLYFAGSDRPLAEIKTAKTVKKKSAFRF